MTIVSLVAALLSCSDSNNDLGEQKVASVNVTVEYVNTWGNLVIDIPEDSLYNAGYENGDIVTISGGSLPESLDMPLTNNMMAAGTWGMFLTQYSNEPTLTIGLVNASFFDRVGGKAGDRLTISMKEKAGFLDINDKMNLWESYSRTDYDSDEMFANFYPVECRGIKSGILYRSSSPLTDNDNTSRYEYADRLARKFGINTIISLSSTETSWQEAQATGRDYGEYCNELYSRGAILFHKVASDLFVDQQAVKVATMLREMTESTPPFLISCSMGRDRTGLMTIILQVLAGATYDDLESSYMRGFYNWHRLQSSSELYQYILTMIFHRTLYILSKEGDVDIAEISRLSSFSIEEIMQDLPAAVDSYLKNKAGMTVEEIEKLKRILSVN
ncbi:MAG: tyrosine-protein phosphatase [Prevotella sp.]